MELLKRIVFWCTEQQSNELYKWLDGKDDFLWSFMFIPNRNIIDLELCDDEEKTVDNPQIALEQLKNLIIKCDELKIETALYVVPYYILKQGNTEAGSLRIDPFDKKISLLGRNELDVVRDIKITWE